MCIGSGRGVRVTIVAFVATVAVLVTAASAAGQGLYYKEITRDGRIYVFNIAAEAARFEASCRTSMS